MLSATFWVALAAAAHAQPIPDAPQDFMLRYLQTLNLSLADTLVIDDLSGRYINNEWIRTNGNEIRRLTVRQKMLSMITDYKPATRVILGMPITLGDYDVSKQQFHLLYPAYGAGQATPVIVGRQTYVPHSQAPESSDSRSLAFDRSGVPAIAGVRMSCTSTGGKSPFDAPQYFDIYAGCNQNDPQPHTLWLEQALRNRSQTASGFFKVIPTNYPPWDYLQAPIEQASMLIDQIAQTQRTIWGVMVFDVLGMELPPGPDFENVDPDEKQAGVKAVFKVRPVALFAWKIDPSRRLVDKNFLFAKGSVTIRQAPPGGVITMDMVGAAPPSATPIVAQPPQPSPTPAPSAPPPKPAAPTAAASGPGCPSNLPADAIKDRCQEQTDLGTAGLYMDATGHVRHLEPRASPTTNPAAPTAAAQGEQPRINFGDPPAPKL